MIEQLKNRLKDLLNSSESIDLERVSGGDISDAFKFIANGKSYFLKTNTADKLPMFESESIGLKELAKGITTPEVIEFGSEGSLSFLLLQWMDSGIKSQEFWEGFGAQLSQMHAITQSQFGYPSDNFIGSLDQKNTESNSWAIFFSSCRISPLVRIAFDNKLLKQWHLGAFDELDKEYQAIFPETKPALLHGDLWSGNFICDTNEMPVLIDPATYYGHPEMEIAFTTMFGGFDQPFYESYFSSTPFSPGFKSRIEVYNLYPLLVHLILFGKSYLKGIEDVLRRFSR